ncbi:HD-GYP domain-containing protein [Aquisalimonas lutea]|uniref:HD-GYP domain-containing protein n=1 Tax=Aquisalimonas lutea TaxID=1327750 RepID=UPI0025B4BF3F|nr:HD-GYP domain-containing protein [Aquisalimonas lutea]MDN3518681.1 HD-GYP domain-containing protein [Aquisalimonas lutea]
MSEQRIPADKLRIGMYVSALDRPWVETPFLFQGFTVENEADLAQLRSLCMEVVVDAERSRVKIPPPRAVAPVVRERRENRAEFREAVHTASRSRERARRFVKGLFSDIRLGRSVDTDEAQAVVSDMLGNIARDASASLWITNLKNRDEYTSLHCLNVCVLTLAFCQHLGYSRDELEQIGLGALLHDVGKTFTPKEILNKPGPLTDEEFAVMQRHPVDGYDVLRSAGNIPEMALKIVRSHHERINGKGYPDGLAGPSIPEPVLAVGIADSYDAMTSDRVYRDGMAAEKALGILHDESPELFGQTFMEAFIRCVGIYPVGSVVELDSGALGLVISVEPEHRLAPRVLLLRTAEGETLQERRILDLVSRADHMRVRRVVSPAETGVDVQAVMLMESGMVPPGHLPVDVARKGRPFQ